MNHLVNVTSQNIVQEKASFVQATFLNATLKSVKTEGLFALKVAVGRIMTNANFSGVHQVRRQINVTTKIPMDPDMEIVGMTDSNKSTFHVNTTMHFAGCFSFVI